MRNHGQRAVIVAVIAVRMVQPPIDQIIDMVAVGHGFVAAIGTVPMPGRVTGRVAFGIAAVGIAVADRNHMLLDAAMVEMFKMAVIEIIDVAFMPHGEMAASGAMDVR